MVPYTRDFKKEYKTLLEINKRIVTINKISNWKLNFNFQIFLFCRSSFICLHIFVPAPFLPHQLFMRDNDDFNSFVCSSSFDDTHYSYFIHIFLRISVRLWWTHELFHSFVDSKKRKANILRTSFWYGTDRKLSVPATAVFVCATAADRMYIV